MFMLLHICMYFLLRINSAHKELFNQSVKGLDQTKINIHKRLLRANTNDYGSYDPAPTFHKPKFKQIPN
ncbi:hypothetical protein DCAR_0101594 [Daucus carota subsp. sativus]|uniref:Uncharacterized protein n=1 Tax=Daucus carota subsp. sativus TaxID=79200 RepID=A0AAF0W396_DAUCS|nr:hypothetical protein DCAR_0101594 [Daucus carota subsp. sativus]